MSKIPFGNIKPQAIPDIKADIETNKQNTEIVSNAIMSPNPLYVNSNLSIKTCYHKLSSISTQTIYEDEFFAIVYNSSLFSLQFKQKTLTPGSSQWVAFSILSPNDSNNNEGSPDSIRGFVAAIRDTPYFFGGLGNYDSDFRLESYGARNTIHVGLLFNPGPNPYSPMYVIDAFCGVYSNVIIKVERIKTI